MTSRPPRTAKKPNGSLKLFVWGVNPQICSKRGWRLGDVIPFGVVAYLQEAAFTPGELLAEADLINYTMGASEKDEEEAIREVVDFSTTASRQTARLVRPALRGALMGLEIGTS
jgi:hypothetical protein